MPYSGRRRDGPSPTLHSYRDGYQWIVKEWQMSRPRYEEGSSASGSQPGRPRGRNRAWLLGRVVGIGIPVGLAVGIVGVAGYLALVGDASVDTEPWVGGCLSDDTLDVEAVACWDESAGAQIVGIVQDTRWHELDDSACAAFPESEAVWAGESTAPLEQTDTVLCVVEPDGE
jgi:hypothetical protein